MSPRLASRQFALGGPVVLARSIFLAGSIFLASPSAWANSPATSGWPQLRGPSEGHSDAVGLPMTWSEEENIVWKVPIPGRGHSSPVVLEGRVWITTALEEQRSLRALGLDTKTGKILVDVEIFRPEAWQASHLDNSYASPTPVLEPGRVYVHFGTYGTASLAPETGNILWSHNALTLDHEVGPGSSPILWRQLLIVNCDGVDQRYVAALDKDTGEIAWRSRRTVALGGIKKGTHHKAFSTPIIVHVKGEPQIITSGADQVSALEPQTGKEIWRVRYEGYSVVPQPVSGPEHVYVDTGYIKPHLLAIRLGGRGDITDSHVDWSYHWQVPANPTPLFIADHLFMINDWGNVTWLEAKSGEDLWRKRLGGRHWASPLHARGRIYTWSSSGETVVLAASSNYQELARNQIEGEIRTTPAIVGRTFYVRTTTHLYRIEDRSKP